LARRGPSFACSRGHLFDIARSGYVNLLQPQDRRATSAGDSAPAIAARVRLLSAGIGQQILNSFVERAASVVAPGAVVVELGSGAGDVLGRLADGRAITAVGIDLSTAAAEMAAKRFPEITWVVANADRRLPILDDTATLVLSLHARRNPAECARVLKPGGSLLTGLAAGDDLIELRQMVQGTGVERARADLFLEEHAAQFELEDRFVVRERHALKRDALGDLLRGSYRGARTSLATRVEALRALEVTLSTEMLLLRKGSVTRDKS
jgi:23S rRNA (guanine745-N1)-methyltransferase